ncbi:dihydrolipoyllysine-residue acetyltransferase (dihydrolipoamide S-acetyltransferase) [Pedobacter sp. BAL39]|uniref:pyruvate dehydrogenase complex dihydrolipoamide acetyltransferase n=1 Tax=Pedobacter sp. BAL39 TaxID=391596 RepID=UPI00015595FB|nr:pyruvate dehydrogenase complex dihydrolipoamide acetyltransferase [Pedobacter sp. BAL39]EDM37535.1 dihydrolipoyllysine-residue acetyltransferase (dihydrolipoamide S-acetyltransferase) [Pedobacter sp. BAL39]
MAEVVKMPKMSDTMTEGVMAKWHKKVGDKIKSGDVMAEVETDKATMDLESYWDGTVLYIGVEEGKAVPVDAIIAVVGKEGEDFQAAIDAEGGAAPAKEDKTADKPAEAKTEEAPKAESSAAAVTDADLEKMGVTVVRMPLLSDTMTEGVIAEWHKKVGDQVKNDDILADVETDKATMEVMGYAEGTLLHIGVEKGAAAKVNGIIAIVGPEGTDISGILAQGDAPAKPAADKKSDAPVAEKTEAAKAEEVPKVATGSDRVKASPLAKRIAKDKGIDLAEVAGSADGGRIIKKDIENFKPAAKPTEAAAAPAEKSAPAIPQYIGEEKFTEKPVTQMRKVIAKRLSESLFTAPHFYLTMSIDMDGAIAARTKINEFAPVKISFNDMVLKAVAIALKQHPAVNSSWLGDKIRYNEHVNIGVAVAVEDGLLVPVVRFADGKSLSHISAEVKDFAQRAKAKKLQPADWEGSTFTISNLGMFGIDEFTAIINPPDACILAIGGISQVPVVKNGAVVPGNVMKVTLSCDHRVVDGATGSAFLQTFKSLLEEPVRLLV